MSKYLQEYEGNMTEYVENMKEYVKNMKKYTKNMKEYYEEICQYIGFGTPISILALGLRKTPSIAFIYSLGLGEIPNFPTLYGPWDLEKFHAGASS